MSKQYYGVIKLAPHIPAWYDAVNEIYLTAKKRWFKCVTDDMDLKPILKGLKAGLVVWDSVENIGTGPADDAKMPVVTFQCHCNIEEEGFGIIEEGVLAPYEPEYDIIPEQPKEEESPVEPPVDPEPEEPVDPDPEPEPEEPEEPEVKNKLEIKIKQNDVEVEEVIIERGTVELSNLVLEIVAEGCEAGFENFKFDLVNSKNVLEGCEGVDVVDQPIEDGIIMIQGLAQPKNFIECEVAVLKVHGQCNCEEPHMVEKEVVIKVAEAKMFCDECPIVEVYNPDELEVQGLDFLLERMNMEVGPIAKRDFDEDENAGTFMGNFILFAPVDAGLELMAWDVLGGEFTIENPGIIIVNGIEYDVQYLDLLSGKNGIQIEVVQN